MEKLRQTTGNSLEKLRRLFEKFPWTSSIYSCAKEFNALELTKELFIEKLRERLTTADIAMVKQDVEPFIIDKRELDIWSNEYFLQLSDMIMFE